MQRWTASSSGNTWVRTFPLAGLVRFAEHNSPASVRSWMMIAFTVATMGHPLPAAFAKGKSHINSTILPPNYAALPGNPEEASVHRSQNSVGQPVLLPPLGGPFGSPLEPTQETAPAVAGHQFTRRDIRDFANGCMGYQLSRRDGLAGKNTRSMAPFHIAQRVTRLGHRTLLPWSRAPYLMFVMTWRASPASTGRQNAAGSLAATTSETAADARGRGFDATF